MTEKEPMEIPNKKRIGIEAKEWEPNLDVVMPINGHDISGFARWINWNGFRQEHQGLDFAAYLNDQDEIVVGLPENTPVRAIADGKIRQSFTPTGDGYDWIVRIEYGDYKDSILSGYYHVVPTVEFGEEVKKGDIIGHLYKDSGDEKGRLVHLHINFEDLNQAKPNRTNIANPEMVFPEQEFIQCSNHESLDPKLIGVENQPKRIIIANFKEIGLPDWL